MKKTRDETWESTRLKKLFFFFQNFLTPQQWVNERDRDREREREKKHNFFFPKRRSKFNLKGNESEIR